MSVGLLKRALLKIPYIVKCIAALLFKVHKVLKIFEALKTAMVLGSDNQRKRREIHSKSGSNSFSNSRESKKSFIVCPECRHVSENEERYKAHFNEPRHVNNYRDLAYKGK